MLELVPSRYNILVPLTHGRALAYNSSHGGLALWSAEERGYYDRVLAEDPTVDPGDPIADEMMSGGYLLHRSTDELAVLEAQHADDRAAARSMSLTLAPTLACNFGCDYCYQGQHKPHDTMSPEVQDAILSLIEAAAPSIRQLSVTWYGGEPLTRKSLIRGLSGRIIRACADLGLEYSATMVTNGYLLDAQTARWLYERHVRSIQVTIDGPPDDHDQRRHLLGGQGTFDRITENLLAIVDTTPELRFSIRVNVDHRNRDGLWALVDRMAALGLGGRPSLEMYFAPVESATEGSQDVHAVCMDKAAYGKLETDLYRHAYDKGLSALPYPRRFTGNCTAVSSKGYVVAPNGDIHRCWETISYPHKAVGSIFDMDSVPRNPGFQRWSRWTPFAHESCRRCRLLPTCAGSCAHKFIYAAEARGPGGLPCPSWKYNIEAHLLLRAETMGAIGPDDYDAAAAYTHPDELEGRDPIENEAAPPATVTQARGTHHDPRVRHLPVLG